jgi:hypothetical protein
MAWPGRLRLSPQHRGRGGPDDVAPHLFKDFTQSLMAETPSEGTDRGLAIRASLVQATRATIGYRPGTDGGASVFIGELPLRLVEPPAMRSPGQIVIRRTRPEVRVLMVDDVAANWKPADVFRQQAGLSVSAADRPAALEALQTCIAHHFGVCPFRRLPSLTRREGGIVSRQRIQAAQTCQSHRGRVPERDRAGRNTGSA